MTEQNWFQKILSGIFDQRGGVYVGMATVAVIIMALGEFVKSGWKAPAWYVSVPFGIYAFILGVFVVRKGAEYYMDSRYNSPPEKLPDPKP